MSTTIHVLALATLVLAATIAAPPAAASGVLPHVWGIAGEGLGFGHDVGCSAQEHVLGYSPSSCTSGD